MVGVILEDDAIRLRPVGLADVDEWMAGEDEEQIRWFEFPGPASREDVERAVNAWMDSWRSGGPVRHWAICDRELGRIAGGVEVRDLGDGQVNLSYVVFPPFRRTGVATRASRLALRYAAGEMGATDAVIKVLDGNAGSLAVARRLGAREIEKTASDGGGMFVVFRLALATEP